VRLAKAQSRRVKMLLELLECSFSYPESSGKIPPARQANSP
jgi:hypothetical protein